MKKRTLLRLFSLALALLLCLSMGAAAHADASSYVMARQTYGSSDSLEFSYNEFGLATRLGLGYVGYNWEEFAPEDVMIIQVRYRYDDAGRPVWLRMDAVGEGEGIEAAIENSPGEDEQGPVQVRLHDIRIFDGDTEEELDENNLSTVWNLAVSALRYAGCYRNAAFTMDGTENSLMLRDGREVVLRNTNGARATQVVRTFDGNGVVTETNSYFERAEDDWVRTYYSTVYFDTRGRITAAEAYEGDGTLRSRFQVRYTTVTNPNGGESIDFGTIMESSNEEQHGLSYSRYYYDADGNLTRAVQITPYTGESASHMEQTTTWDYAPDGQLLRKEAIRYRDGEIESHTLEEYVSLWDALLGNA